MRRRDFIAGAGAAGGDAGGRVYRRVGKLAPITDEHLLATIGNFPAEWQRDASKRSFWLAISVVKYFLGADWLDEHVSWETKAPGFLRVIVGHSAETQISTFKIVDFAELLWNLQVIGGIDTCIDRLQRGIIEPTYAELDLGRMLLCGGVNFSFVEPQQQRGFDYDIEITLPDGTIVCADAKCKVGATEFSADTVKHSLEKARRQFSKDRPSIVFMKVPPRWIRQPAPFSLNEVADRFLRGTGRIVSVKFYFSEIVHAEGTLRHDHSFKEISNPNNRFDQSRDWTMFTDPPAPRGWNGMPSTWRRLLFFPNEGRR
jgi:hypothetical protein